MRRRVSNRSDEFIYAFGAGVDHISGVGTGEPYDADPFPGTTNKFKGPNATFGASVSFTIDVNIVGTTAGTNVDWTASGYSPSAGGKLTLLEYYSGANSSDFLHGVSNLFIDDVQVFYGTGLTGAGAPTGGSTFNIILWAYPSLDQVWAVNSAIGGTNGRMLGAMASSTDRIIGNSYGNNKLALSIGVAGFNCSAGRFRLSILGREF